MEVKRQTEEQQSCEAEPVSYHNWSFYFDKNYTSFTVSAQAVQLVIWHCIKKKKKKQPRPTDTHINPQTKTLTLSFLKIFAFWNCSGEIKVLASATKKISK